MALTLSGIRLVGILITLSAIYGLPVGSTPPPMTTCIAGMTRSPFFMELPLNPMLPIICWPQAFIHPLIFILMCLSDINSGYSSLNMASRTPESPVLFVTPRLHVSVPGQAVMSAIES